MINHSAPLPTQDTQYLSVPRYYFWKYFIHATLTFHTSFTFFGFIWGRTYHSGKCSCISHKWWQISKYTGNNFIMWWVLVLDDLYLHPFGMSINQSILFWCFTHTWVNAIKWVSGHSWKPRDRMPSAQNKNHKWYPSPRLFVSPHSHTSSVISRSPGSVTFIIEGILYKSYRTARI